MADRTVHRPRGPGGRARRGEKPLLIPELVHLGRHRGVAASEAGLVPHAHPGVLEVCLLVRGAVDWWAGEGAGGVRHLRAGMLSVTRPGEPHGGVDGVLHPCHLLWLQLTLGSRDGSSLAEVAAGGARTLRAKLGALPTAAFAAPAGVDAAFEDLLLEHQRPHASAPLARLHARSALLRVLLGVLGGHAAAGDRPGELRPSPEIETARTWMAGRLAEPDTVADAAAVAGMSAPRFHARFVAEVGLPPHDWKLRQRIALARRRLREGDEPITELALSLGFHSSQHFATTFRRLAGLTPSACRAAALT